MRGRQQTGYGGPCRSRLRSLGLILNVLESHCKVLKQREDMIWFLYFYKIILATVCRSNRRGERRKQEEQLTLYCDCRRREPGAWPSGEEEEREGLCDRIWRGTHRTCGCQRVGLARRETASRGPVGEFTEQVGEFTELRKIRNGGSGVRGSI